MIPEVTGIVLAGGKSTRMKMDKAALARGENTLLEIVVDKLRKVCSRIIIVSGENRYQVKGCLVVPDIYQRCGPLGGIYTGLYYAQTPYSIVTACDMPLFDGALASFLFERSDGYQVVVPHDGKYYEPLAALYHKSCLPVFSSILKRGPGKITDAYSQLKIRTVPVKEIEDAGMENVFLNINTPEDWALYCRISSGIEQNKHNPGINPDIGIQD